MGVNKFYGVAMPGPIGASILQILKVVTPTEIARIAAAAEDAPKRPLIQVIIEDEELNDANLRFKRDSKTKEMLFTQGEKHKKDFCNWRYCLPYYPWLCFLFYFV